MAIGVLTEVSTAFRAVQVTERKRRKQRISVFYRILLNMIYYWYAVTERSRGGVPFSLIQKPEVCFFSSGAAISAAADRRPGGHLEWHDLSQLDRGSNPKYS